MGVTTFKGVIGTGTVTADFLSDSSNQDSDILIAAFASVGGGQTDLDRGVTAPGGSVRVSVQAPVDGILEVIVSIGTELDRGHLTVSSSDSVVNDEPIRGSVRWVYSVQEGA